jgi:ABC-2 type transport system ATP-binding protein
MHERQVLGGSVLLFDRVDHQQLVELGEVRTPSVADLFVAVLGDMSGNMSGNHAGPAQGVAL